ncbi:SdpI family protein [Tumebacillus lipolyticus]|uniref:SdpI family protein n=1 Tax=Tumebacillus lipolyticus TaxID=1280370 RepID=A0ABW5A2V5_9BACL
MKKHFLPLLIILATFGIGLWAYPQLPDIVPSHWGPDGEIDGYSNKNTILWIMPGIMLLIYLLLLFLPKIDPNRASQPRNQKVLVLINTLVMVILLGIHCLIISEWLGFGFDMSKLAPVIVGAIFLVIGNFMPRVQHNYFVGIRTPWTLANEEVWRKTHLFSGRVFVVTGLLLLLSLLLPSSWQLYSLLTLIIGSTLVILGSSYYFYKQLDSVR